MQRYSSKRQAILDCLRSTTEHPTADWIYFRLKPKFPNLSLATVYRNLNQLKQSGEVRSLGTVDGQERFDANVNPHTHAVCTVCGRIVDSADVTVPDELIELVQKCTGFKVSGSNLQFFGVCPECSAKKTE